VSILQEVGINCFYTQDTGFNGGSIVSKINEQVTKTIENEKSKFEADTEYRKLRDFLDKAKEAGLVTKRTYSIPQPDTIGKKLRESIKTRVGK